MLAFMADSRSGLTSGRALITGATAGIGHSFAQALATRGLDLVLVARDESRLTSIAEALRTAHGIGVEVFRADLTVAEDLERVSARISSTTDPVTVVVNNAGASIAGWFGATDIAAEDRQLDLLVRAPMHLMDAALKALPDRATVGNAPRGVINVASVAAWTPRGAYSAHKSWLVNISQWANLQYGAQGIVVQALCPGFTRTEFHQRMAADTSDIPGWMWLKADRVVAESIADFERGKAISIPYKRYKVLALLARYAPAWLVKRAAKRGR